MLISAAILRTPPRVALQFKQRFIPSALGGAAVGALGGMMITLTRLGELPFASWWVPALLSAVMAISLQKTFADMLEHGRPPDV